MGFFELEGFFGWGAELWFEGLELVHFERRLLCGVGVE